MICSCGVILGRAGLPQDAGRPEAPALHGGQPRAPAPAAAAPAVPGGEAAAAAPAPEEPAAEPAVSRRLPAVALAAGLVLLPAGGAGLLRFTGTPPAAPPPPPPADLPPPPPPAPKAKPTPRPAAAKPKPKPAKRPAAVAKKKKPKKPTPKPVRRMSADEQAAQTLNFGTLLVGAAATLSLGALTVKKARAVQARKSMMRGKGMPRPNMKRKYPKGFEVNGFRPKSVDKAIAAGRSVQSFEIDVSRPDRGEAAGDGRSD